METDIEIKVSTEIYASVPKVWDALTKPELIKKYFFGTDASSDWKVGSPVRFSGEYEGKTYHDKGTVLKNEPYKLLSYTYWSSMSGIADLPENYVTVSYELQDEGNKTRLTVRQQNIPDEQMKAHAEQNWKKVLHSIKEMLEK
jgi:uncharacterized protein YndB with AHSA1/START domain